MVRVMLAPLTRLFLFLGVSASPLLNQLMADVIDWFPGVIRWFVAFPFDEKLLLSAD